MSVDIQDLLTPGQHDAIVAMTNLMAGREESYLAVADEVLRQTLLRYLGSAMDSLVDEFIANLQRDRTQMFPAPKTAEFVEWQKIYGLEDVPRRDWDEFARDHGWQLDNTLLYIARAEYGQSGETILTQDQDGELMFYVTKDLRGRVPEEGESIQIFYSAPKILGSI